MFSKVHNVLAILPAFILLTSGFEYRAGFVGPTVLRSISRGDSPRGSCLADRRWSISTEVSRGSPALRTLHVRSYHGSQKNSPAALDSTTAWNNNADKPSLNPSEVFERLREEKLKNSSPLQRWAERLAPQDDMEKLKLNWVGDIDRHQRKLFWSLMEMLCEKIAPILLACRAVHDFIIATQARIRYVVHQTRTKWIPALALASKVAVIHAVKAARIAAREFIIASIATVRAGGQARAMLRQREVRSAAVNGGAAEVIGSQSPVLAQTVQVSAIAAPQTGGVQQRTEGTGLEKGGQSRALGDKASAAGEMKEEEREASGLKRMWNHIRSFDLIL